MANRRFIRWMAVVPAAVVTTLGLSAAKRPETKRVALCEVATAWVKDHMNSLPKTEAGLGEIGIAYRKAVYRVLSKSEKAVIWHEHFARYLKNDSSLRGEQREFVRQTDARFEAYLEPTTGKDAMKADDIEARAKAMFGRVRADELFASLGNSPSSVIRTATETSGPSSDAGDLQFCECSTASPFCFFFRAESRPSCDTCRGDCVISQPQECGSK